MTPAVTVVKLGGSLDDPAALLDDIAAHRGPVVMVHGAHRVLDRLAADLGHPPRFVTSASGAVSRFTDDAAMDHFLMAYCGLVNKRLVQQLLGRGVTAVGLAALDGGMVRGRRRAHLRIRDAGRTVVLHGDHAGSIESVDPALLRRLLGSGVIPVLCPPALGDDGAPINVDGDRLAAELSVALHAERLVIFADTAGFLADPGDPASTVSRATLAGIPALRSAAAGRARVKLAAVERALTSGINAVGICDGRPAHPLRAALAGAGSWFTTADDGEGLADTEVAARA